MRASNYCTARRQRSPEQISLWLVGAYRSHGHLAARLDPLGSEPVGDPSLEPDRSEPPLTGRDARVAG